MKSPNVTRRGLIAGSARLLPAVGLLPLAARAVAAECADPSDSLRMSLHYVEKFEDQAKSCSACGFFTAESDPKACGNCKIFSGPANPAGHCDSWSAKGG